MWKVETSIRGLVLILMWTNATTIAAQERFSGVEYHGLAMPTRSATLASPVNGTVASVLVKEGSRVREGEPLLRLDARVARAEAQAAQRAAEHKSALRSAELDYARTNVRFSRLLTAQKSGASTVVEVQDAEIQLEQAKTMVAIENERMAQLQDVAELAAARLALYEIVAPFDGRILRVNVEQGEGTQSEDGMLRIADLRTLSADIYLPMARFGKLQVADTVTIWAGEPLNRELSAKVVYVSPEIDAPTRAFRCIVEIDNNAETLPAGFRVELKK